MGNGQYCSTGKGGLVQVARVWKGESLNCGVSKAHFRAKFYETMLRMVPNDGRSRNKNMKPTFLLNKISRKRKPGFLKNAILYHFFSFKFSFQCAKSTVSAYIFRGTKIKTNFINKIFEKFRWYFNDYFLCICSILWLGMTSNVLITLSHAICCAWSLTLEVRPRSYWDHEGK